MSYLTIFKHYIEQVFQGRRAEAREIIFGAHDRGFEAAKLLQNVIWPALDQIEKLYRSHHMSLITEHMAVRINRTMADQLQGALPRRPKSGKRMVVTCGHGESEELGAQIIADLFESQGWSVWFVGSGVPNDEILSWVGQVDPDILCIYGANPSGVPNIRKLIALIREIGVCEQMQILVAGGVFNRADGLAEEVKADLSAGDVTEAMKVVDDNPVRVPKPDVPEPGRRRKRKKRKTVSASTVKKMRKGRKKSAAA